MNNKLTAALQLVVRQTEVTVDVGDCADILNLERVFGYRSTLAQEVWEYTRHLARRAGHPHPELLAQVARGAMVSALSITPADLPVVVDQEGLRDDEIADFWEECEDGTCPTCRILGKADGR